MNLNNLIIGLILLAGLSTQVSLADSAITGEDYAHGHEQLQQMLTDRPALNRILVKDDPLMIWTAAQFAGTQSGFRIYWDNTHPPDGIEAQHQSVHDSEDGLAERVLVHPVYQTGSERGQPKTAHNLWADLIYELHNIRGKPVFVDAYQQAISGKLGYDDWLRTLTEAEHRALVETAEFYRTRWRIWMRSRNLNPASSHWMGILSVPASYFEWISAYTDPDDYPWSAYGAYYRDEIQPFLIRRNLQYRYNPFSLPPAGSSTPEHVGGQQQQQQ